MRDLIYLKIIINRGLGEEILKSLFKMNDLKCLITTSFLSDFRHFINEDFLVELDK